MPETCKVTHTIETDFADAIHSAILFGKVRCAVETGTCFGNGTTAVILEALEEGAMPDSALYSIECNYRRYDIARRRTVSPRARFLYGLSIPRELLPNLDDIKVICANVPPGIHLDYPLKLCARTYTRESTCDGPDDLLGKIMQRETPDFILLDSAGHLGFIEFRYVLARLHAPCTIALDDVNHIKHHASFELAKADKRFSIIEQGDERFGWAILRFDGQEAR